MMGLFLVAIGLIGMGLKGLYRTLDSADEQGVIKKAAQDGANKVIEKFLK